MLGKITLLTLTVGADYWALTNADYHTLINNVPSLVGVFHQESDGYWYAGKNSISEPDTLTYMDLYEIEFIAAENISSGQTNGAF